MVKTGQIAIYYGAGKGKTSVSLGKGVRALGENLRVVMIQFMDYHNNQEIALLEKLEPDFRIFHFEKNREGTEMTEEIRKEIASEIRNAFNFTKKILDTGECDMLMLDGILECILNGLSMTHLRLHKSFSCSQASDCKAPYKHPFCFYVLIDYQKVYHS